MLVIAGGENALSKLLLSNPIARFLGRISYSLYLVHWPLIVFWIYVHNRKLFVHEQVALAVVSAVLATALYYLVETRFRKPWTRNSTSENSNVYARISPLVIATVMLGSYIWAQNGWNWRLSDESLSIANQLESDQPLQCRTKKIDGFVNGLSLIHI